MINVKDKSQIVEVKLVANWAKNDSNKYIFSLFDTIKRTTNTITVTDKLPTSTFYYLFDVDLTSFSSGEYEYTLTNSDELIVATGVIEITESKNTNTYGEDIEYVIYETK